jgi:hypothetical protein
MFAVLLTPLPTLSLLNVSIYRPPLPPKKQNKAWVCERPIVGDDDYDGGTASAMCFRDRGLFLCSNRVSLEHPFYNSPEGRRVYDRLFEKENKMEQQLDHGRIWKRPSDDTIMITISIDTPTKFDSFLDHEEARFIKFSSTSSLEGAR